MLLGRERGFGYSGHVSFTGNRPLPHLEKPGELRVSRAEIAQMERAAAVLADCRERLAASRRGILAEVAPDGGAQNADELVDWRHYPEGEVYDPASHAHYFYHVHPADRRPPREHGHFHTFLRAEGMPAGVVPLVLPEAAVAEAAPPPQGAPLKRGARDEVSHLVAISLDAQGEPFRLFTTNRWVTGETWYRAGDVIAMLDRFAITGATPRALRDRWLVAVMQLFRPQIAALLRQRDETVMARRRRQRANVLEDPRLEVTSSLEIDLGAQLAFIAWARSEAVAVAQRRAPDPPRMAEGWDGRRPA
jgi:hypothetical protein